MGTASDLYMNWTGCTVTYGATPTVVNLSEIVEIDMQPGAETKRWYADAAVYPKALGAKNKTRKFTIRGGAINLLATVPANTPCIVVAILNDFNNGTGTGAITYTMINAVVINNPFKGQNNEFGMGDLEFECYSSDGITDPISFVVAT